MSVGSGGVSDVLPLLVSVTKVVTNSMPGISGEVSSKAPPPANLGFRVSEGMLQKAV